MKILLAFSGGLDSTCLLTMLLRDELAEFSNINLHVVHINHGLNHHSEQWVEHCQKLCGQHELPFQQINLSIDTGNGASLEAEARRQRYQAFTGLMSEGDILLTAHHQNDQAETFLLQALRGAGVKGLAAMPFKKRFAQGWHIRPLLSMTRQELEQYAAQHQLNWVEDESNADSRFDRNLLRNQIFPLLRQRWPSVHQSLRQSAQYCAQADELIHDLAVIDLPTCADDQQTLTISKLLELSTARQKNVIRFWLQQQKCRVPAGIFIQRILDEVMVARVDSNPQVTWSGGEVRRFQGRLYALAALPLDNSNQYTWQGMDDLDLDTHLLSKQSRLGAGLAVTKLPEQLTVRFRQGGESIKVNVTEGTRDLKKLLQEWQVPPWQRASIPLIYGGDQLLAVVGYCYNADYVAQADQAGLCISAHTREE